MIKKYCAICGKEDECIHIFKDGNTSNSHPANMITACLKCSQTFKWNRLHQAATTLNKMGFRYYNNKWQYNSKLIRSDTIDAQALEYQVKYLKKEIKELKYLLNFKKNQ